MLDPVFTSDQAAGIDTDTATHVDLAGKPYLPGKSFTCIDNNGLKVCVKKGYIGLNNVKANDYINAVVQGLSQVTPLRTYFLVNKFEKSGELGSLFNCTVGFGD